MYDDDKDDDMPPNTGFQWRMARGIFTKREPVVCPLERASGGVERYGPRRTFSLHPEGIYF